MAHDVFISHAKDDKTKADLLCLQLEQAGIRCWIAPRDVRPGRNWGSEIIRGLDNARVMILLLSASSNRSRPVIKEVERAFGKEIVIIPVRLEEVIPSEALEFFLSSDQWFDAITPPLESHLDRIAMVIKEYLAEGATDVARPTAPEPIAKDDANKAPVTAVGPALVEGISEPALPGRSAGQEAHPSMVVTGKERDEKASSAPQTEPATPSPQGTVAPIEDPVYRKWDTPDRSSTLPPLSAPDQSTDVAVERAKTEPSTIGPSQGERLPQQGRPALWQTPKGRGILALCAGLAIAAVALIVMLSQSQTKQQQSHASPTATPVAAATSAKDFLKQELIELTPGASSTPYKRLDISNPKLGEQLLKNAPESTANVAYRANSQAVTLLSLSTATKEHPFVNSLGMKFVPVPGTDVLFSVWETRVEDYQAFCDARGKTWDKPRFPQSADHPAVKVSWNDATEFCEWLSGKEGKKYRLPTDHEWSCAVGIGDQEDAAASPQSKSGKIADVFPWGEQWPPPNDAGNYTGQECNTPAGLAALKAAGYDASNWTVIEEFNDGNVFTAAAGSFRPNKLGIFDLGGNVWEGCQDQYDPDSTERVLRGGSWYPDSRDLLLSSFRLSIPPAHRNQSVGFRVVVEAGFGH